MRDKALQRLSDHVDVDWSHGHAQSGEVEVCKMTVVESGRVRPGRDVPGELSLVSRSEDVFEVADMELDHSVTETSK